MYDISDPYFTSTSPETQSTGNIPGCDCGCHLRCCSCCYTINGSSLLESTRPESRQERRSSQPNHHLVEEPRPYLTGQEGVEQVPPGFLPARPGPLFGPAEQDLSRQPTAHDSSLPFWRFMYGGEMREHFTTDFWEDSVDSGEDDSEDSVSSPSLADSMIVHCESGGSSMIICAGGSGDNPMTSSIQSLLQNVNPEDGNPQAPHPVDEDGNGRNGKH